MIGVSLKASDKGFYKKDNSLFLRLKEAIRKIGCYCVDKNQFGHIGDPEIIQLNTIGGNLIEFLIRKSELPNNFDYLDLYDRKYLLQFELCMPTELINDGEYIKIKLFPGHLYIPYAL